MKTATKLKWFNLVMTCIWIVLIIPSWMWWKRSILWVILISLWANIIGHFAAYAAHRTEEAQETGHNLTKADREWIMEIIAKGD